MEKTANHKTMVVILLRRTVAHVVAVTFAAHAIVVGVTILVSGMTSISTAFEVGPMYLAALLMLSIFSLPVGLILRYLFDKVPVRPIVCLCSIGIILGLCLIPVMHPELTDERMVFEKYRAELFLIHGIAGLLGGALWWLVELKILRMRAT